MRAGDGERLHAEVASVLDWWTLAGVGETAGERPRDWLRPHAPSPPAAVAPAVAASAEPALPATLDAFLAWLADGGDEALLGPAALRVAPAGARDAALMVLVDMPGAEDAEAGHPVSGAAGRLLDRMLAAIGTTRAAVWLAPLVPARPAGARLDPVRLAALGAVARHHVALVRPQRLLLMGAATSEAVLGQPHHTARGRLHDLDGVAAVATFSAAVLLGAPAMKPGAWADLRLLLDGGRS